MKKLLMILAAASIACAACAQATPQKKDTPPPSVSISANGDDVRTVLHSLFTQVHKNYVLEPNIRFVLYLSLSDMDFDEALELVCKTASLKYEIQNGIYFVGKAKPASGSTAPSGKLPQTVLNKIVKTHLVKVDMRALFTELGKQTGVRFEVSERVPAYKLDAFLNGTSLKYALDNITEAAGLQYRFTDRQSIEIIQPEKEASHVAIVTPPKS
jgi:type II secretory pathway component GspD/PulD (secretin)